MTDASQLIDLSHTVEHGLITYKGLPAPIICDYLSREDSRKFYAPGTEFQIGKIEMVANTGTYLDSPFHRYADGKDLSQLELSQLADLPAIKLNCEGKQSVNASCFPPPADLVGKAVLVQTGWSRHWNTPQYFEGHPFLTEDAARLLSDFGVILVGIDSHNIDDVQDMRRPHDEPECPASSGIPLLCRTSPGQRLRHVSGARIRQAVMPRNLWLREIQALRLIPIWSIYSSACN